MRFNKFKPDGTSEEVSLDELPPEIQDEFTKSILEWENSPYVRPLDVLEQGGTTMPPADTLRDAELTAKLWEVIDHLALLRIFLHSTDHLDDRSLYVQLREVSLIEEIQLYPGDLAGAWHIDLIGSGSEEDLQIMLAYYSNEEERESARKQFGMRLPPMEKLPFDRSHRMPVRKFPPDEGMPN